MLSKKNVLPNFLKTLILTSVATFSMSAFAEDVQTKDLYDISAEGATIQSDETLNLAPVSVEQTAQEALEKAEMDKELEKAPH